jgi:hypothetical protein
MKKLIVIVAVILATCGYSFGQELGLRFGYYDRSNVAIDGIFSTSHFSRLHADVAFFSEGGVGIDLLWDFLYRPIGGEAFNWYLGAGPYTVLDDPFHLGVAAEIGLEYRFNSVPIAIGADWRPKLSIIENTDLYAGGFGVNVRFVFGKK